MKTVKVTVCTVKVHYAYEEFEVQVPDDTDTTCPDAMAEAAEEAGADAGGVGICAQCSGWGARHSAELLDDPVASRTYTEEGNVTLDSYDETGWDLWGEGSG